MAGLNNVSPSDESLLKRSKEGDKSAFEVFYQRHKRRILNYIYRMIGNIGSAEELTQEVFIKAYINLSNYTPQGKPLAWIYTIAKNLCKNFLRNKKYQPQLLLDKELPGMEGLSLLDVIPAEGKSPSDLAMDNEIEDLIQKSINLIPLKYRVVLILCDIQRCSYEEAAQILKCRIGSVGSRLSRARLILARASKRYFLENR